MPETTPVEIYWWHHVCVKCGHMYNSGGELSPLLRHLGVDFETCQHQHALVLDVHANPIIWANVVKLIQGIVRKPVAFCDDNLNTESPSWHRTTKWRGDADW